MQGLATRVAVTAPNLQQACSSVTICFEYICIVNTIKVLDISFLHMHGISTSHNKRQVSEWHVACHAVPKLAGICVSLLQLTADAQVLSGLLKSKISNKKAVYLGKQSLRDWIP